jgi:tRNA-Thr(GGU) m(6)t(6)A37 methyltransferase TsaA
MKKPVHFELHPIGTVRSPFKTTRDAPHQGRFSDVESEIIVFDDYVPGLRDVEHYPHLIILSWFDRADRSSLFATPPHLRIEFGVFATRSPNRPNPIGLSLVDLIARSGGLLRVRGLDAIEGTPVLDIKPYTPDIDCIGTLRRAAPEAKPPG